MLILLSVDPETIFYWKAFSLAITGGLAIAGIFSDFCKKHPQRIILIILILIFTTITIILEAVDTDEKIVSQTVTDKMQSNVEKGLGKSDTSNRKLDTALVLSDSSIQKLIDLQKRANTLVIKLNDEIILQKNTNKSTTDLYKNMKEDNTLRLKNHARRLKNTFKQIELLYCYLDFKLGIEYSDTTLRKQKFGENVFKIYNLLLSEFDNTVLKFNPPVDSIWSDTEDKINKLGWNFVGYSSYNLSQTLGYTIGFMESFVNHINYYLQANDREFLTTLTPYKTF